MRSDFFKYLLLYWFCAQIFFISLVNAEFNEDMWMEPDAWARDHLATSSFQTTNKKCCRCADEIDNEKSVQDLKETVAEDTASSIYFKKFVTILFNRKNFKYDSTRQHFERSVVFTIKSHQMDKLEQLLDPRDLDNILVEVFNNMGTISMNFDGEEVLRDRETSTTIKTIVFNILYDLRQLIKTSEMQFVLVVISVLLIAWFINRRLKISWLLLLSGGVLTYGYFHTYLECNRELEAKQMLEILNSSTENEIKTSKVLNFFKGLFNSDDVNIRQQQKIRQSAKLYLRFCRPDHVFLMYLNDIFLKYLHVLIEQCTVTITSLNNSLGFPYNLLTPVFVVGLIGYLLKLTFKYILSPSAWNQLFHHQNEKVSKNALNSEDDRISGDNLRLLLNAINVAPQRKAVTSALQKSTDVSGVEDVKEAIETSLEKSSPKADKSTSEKVKQTNISSKNRRQKSEKNYAAIEDLPEHS